MEILRFSITQILREINFVDSRSAESAFLTHLEAPNLDFFLSFFALFRAEIYQLKKISDPQSGKYGSFRTTRFHVTKI